MVLTPRSPGAPPPKPQRRSSILAFRPSTSPGLPPPPSSSHSHAAIPAIPRTASTDALRRLAQDLNLKDPREVDRWSAFFPLQDTPEEEQVIYAEASQRISTSGTPSLLSLGRSLVRRASTSLNRPGKSRKRSQDIDVPLPLTLTLPISVPVTDRNRPVTATTDIIIGSPPQPRHSISKRPSFLRRMKSLSRTRRDAVSNPSGQGAADCSFLPQPPPILGQQLHQLDWQRPGAAARASAAAAANANMHPGRPGLLTRKDTKCSRAGTPGHFMEMAYSKVDYAMEVDSVIEPLDNTGPDPFTLLPPELASMILSHLDHKSLCTVSRLSRGWYAFASANNGSLWREVFLNRFKTRQATPAAPLPMGGAGIGKLDCHKNDWKRKFQAREMLDRNWKAGKADAIYFQGHTDSVYCAQFDEHKIITGSRDRTIRVWDINTYQCLKVIGGPAAKPARPANHEAPLDCHPNTIHKGVNLNGTPAGDALYHVPEEYHSASVLCLRFDEEIMVTGSSDATCIVWDMKTWEPKFRLRHHNAGVLDVCFDKRYIVSCSKDNSICVWNRNTGDLIRVLQGHRGPVNALQMRGNLLISASSDGVTRLWNLNDLKYIKSFTSRDRGLAAVEFSDDAKYVLAGGNDQVIHKYEVETGALIHTYAGHQGLVRSLFLDSENNRVISGSYDQAVRVYDFNSGIGLGGDDPEPVQSQSPSSTRTAGGPGAYENWTTSWILSAKSDYRRIVATSQDGRALLMDFGKGIDHKLLDLLKGDA